MEAKKSPKADLESKRSMFFQIGFIMAIGIVLIAFSWGTKVEPANVFSGGEPIETEVDFIPITKPEDKPKEMPKPVVIEVIDIVDDHSESIDESLDFTSEATKETVIDLIPTVPEETSKPEPVFLIGQLEENPEFPGGMLGLQKYLSQSVRYPSLAQEQNIQGTVYLTFIINKEGKVENVSILRGVDKALDNEALRVVSSLPTWKPGRQNGRPVKVSFQVPIKFQLQN
jgi:TonB family C-terminal domain